MDTQGTCPIRLVQRAWCSIIRPSPRPCGGLSSCSSGIMAHSAGDGIHSRRNRRSRIHKGNIPGPLRGGRNGSGHNHRTCPEGKRDVRGDTFRFPGGVLSVPEEAPANQNESSEPALASFLERYEGVVMQTWSVLSAKADQCNLLGYTTVSVPLQDLFHLEGMLQG